MIIYDRIDFTNTYVKKLLLLQFQAWARENRQILGDSYNSVVNNAESVRNEFIWVAETQGDVLNYIQGNEDTFSTSTQAPVVTTVATTISPPSLSEPVAPEIADSAVTTALSVAVVTVVAVVNLAL